MSENKVNPIELVAKFNKHKGSIKALEEEGFKIKVKVYRLREDDGKGLRQTFQQAKAHGVLNHSLYTSDPKMRGKTTINSMLKAKLESVLLGCPELRGEHEEACKDIASMTGTEDSENYKNAMKQVIRSSYISPFGGRSEVEVITPNGDKFIGKGQCHIADMFNNHIAQTKAFSDVAKQLFQAAVIQTGLDKGSVRSKLKQLVG